MPVDNSGKGIRSTRRIAIEEIANSQQRNREQTEKRAKGEIACAECCRLKLRCDKQVPCSSCVRRGCQTICPNGSLVPASNGSRFVLADTEHLHDRLNDMSERIRQLEDALEITHGAHSTISHPLLREDLLTIKRVSDIEHPPKEEPKVDVDSLDAIGTLSISGNGLSKFIGRSGGDESLLLSAEPQPDLLGREADPQEPSSYSWPFIAKPTTTREVLLQVKSHIPSLERASTLIETYLEQFSWHVRIVRRDQLMDELIPLFYKRGSNGVNGPSDAEVVDTSAQSMHNMALLFAVFALGALVDLTLPPFNEEAEKYYLLSRSLINLETLSHGTTLTAIQVMSCLGIYCALSDRKQTLEPALLIYSLGLNISYTIGLHRDPARWNLDKKTVERRRDVFWQLFTGLNWQSAGSGRPLPLPVRFVDCEFPEDEEPNMDESGNAQPGFWRWRYRFTKEVLQPVNDIITACGPVKYSEIMEMDRKIREFAIPKHLQAPDCAPNETFSLNWEVEGVYKSMQRMSPLVCRNGALLHLHRSFFSRAMLENPSNPMQSPFAPSFLAVYRCSLSVLKSAKECFNACPNLMLRFFVLWKHMFTSLVVLGTVVQRGPTFNLAPVALAEFNSGLRLYEEFSKYAGYASRALSVLIPLREKIQRTYARLQAKGSVAAQTVLESALSNEDEEEWKNQLAIFGGQSRIVFAKRKNTIPGTDVPQSISNPQTPESHRTPSSTNESPGSTPYSNDLSSFSGSESGLLFSSDFDTSLSQYVDLPENVLLSYLTNPAIGQPTASFLSAVEGAAQFGPDPWMSQVAEQLQPVTADFVPPGTSGPYNYSTGPPPTLAQPQLDQITDQVDFSGQDPTIDSAWTTFLQHSGLMVPTP